MRLSRTGCLTAVLILGVFAGPSSASTLELFNPDWSITLTNFGYSDLLFDQRPGFEGREYLSGEWGGAVSYSKGGVPVSPTWLEPEWLFPEWSTNSTFGVVTPISPFASPDPAVISAAMSVISNGDLLITQLYEMIDTAFVGTPGIEQGLEPAVTGSDPGASATSNRYVLRHTYEIGNISGELIEDVNLFQLLHGLNSNEAVYDDRDYGGTLGEYHYDITERGPSGFFSDDGFYLFDDIIAFHSRVAPTAFEVGRFGDDTVDNHVIGKPSVGVHLSVETDALDGTDFFAPSNLWVGGAQKFLVAPLLAPEEYAAFDLLLSISTTQQFFPGPVIPEPSTFVLMGLGALGLIGMSRKR